MNTLALSLVRLADNPKRQSLVGGGLERAKLPFSGFQRAEHFGGYEVEKKSGQTSIELELGYKFWVDFSESFSKRTRTRVSAEKCEQCGAIFLAGSKIFLSFL